MENLEYNYIKQKIKSNNKRYFTHTHIQYFLSLKYFILSAHPDVTNKIFCVIKERIYFERERKRERELVEMRLR